jgi:uncharacterized protein with ACT and thioredoxin-like domain
MGESIMHWDKIWIDEYTNSNIVHNLEVNEKKVLKQILGFFVAHEGIGTIEDITAYMKSDPQPINIRMKKAIQGIYGK